MPVKAKSRLVEAVVGALKLIVKLPLVDGSEAFVPVATEMVSTGVNVVKLQILLPDIPANGLL